MHTFCNVLAGLFTAWVCWQVPLAVWPVGLLALIWVVFARDLQPWVFLGLTIVWVLHALFGRRCHYWR